MHDAKSTAGPGEHNASAWPDEEWLEGVHNALVRAAKQAHLVAYQKGTGVVTRRNGKVAVVAPDPAMYEDLIPPPFVESPEP